MHCQVVVLSEEMPGPMWIGGISWVLWAGESGSHAEDFSVWMAHTPLDELTDVFTSNYPPGSLVLTAVVDSLCISGPQGTLVTVELDEPFHYNGTDNLLIETDYGGTAVYASDWGWDSGSNRGLTAFYNGSGSGPSGYLEENIPYMVLTSPEAFGTATFGGIKVLLGGDE